MDFKWVSKEQEVNGKLMKEAKGCLWNWKIRLKYIRSDQQQADTLSKPLARVKFMLFRD